MFGVIVMTHARILVAVCLAALLVVGCADLEVQKLDRTDNAPLKGALTYFLPRTAVNIAMTVSVTRCGTLSADPPPDPGAPAPPAKDEVDFKIAATATPFIEADPDAEYAIDYDKAESWLKEINFTVNRTPGRVLQSFNGTINDQSGPIAVATLTAIVQTGGAVAMPGASQLHGPAALMLDRSVPTKQVSSEIYCSETVIASLEKTRDYQVTISQLKNQISKYQRSSANQIGQNKLDPTAAWTQEITSLQAKVSAETAKTLSRSISFKWIPRETGGSTGEIAFAKALDKPDALDGQDLYVGALQLPVSTLVRSFLSSPTDAGMLSKDAAGVIVRLGCNDVKRSAKLSVANHHACGVARRQVMRGAIVTDPIEKSLYDAYGTDWYDNASNQQDAPDAGHQPWYKAHAPFVLVAVSDGNTVFLDSQFRPAADDAAMKMKDNPLDKPPGLVIRDPAVGFLQKCTLSKDSAKWPELQRDAGGDWFYAPRTVVATKQASGLACPTPSFVKTDGSTDSDDSSRVAATFPQFGRVLALDAHSGVFENATLNLTLNTDGTLQSIGTHDLSTAATGLSGVATAAQAAASAETARNNAVTAANGATTAQIQLQDTKNKALADCLAQAKLITAAGGTPAPCQ